MTVLRKRRMVLHLAFQAEPAEPPIGLVQMNLFAQPPLRADAMAVAHDRHSDHKLGIDRRTAHRAVIRRQVRAHLAGIHEAVDRARQVIARNVILEAELVEQSSLVDPTLAHHWLHPRKDGRGESVIEPVRKGGLFQHNRLFGDVHGRHALDRFTVKTGPSGTASSAGSNRDRTRFSGSLPVIPFRARIADPREIVDGRPARHPQLPFLGHGRELLGDPVQSQGRLFEHGDLEGEGHWARDFDRPGS